MPTFESGPGLLLVFAELGQKVTEPEFHEWYDDEHIPLRTSSLKEFVTAARFEALDGQEPKWGAMYSISDNTLFGREEYTKLRANRSPREGQLVANLAVLDRRIYKLASSPSSEPTTSSAHPTAIIFHAVTPKSSSSTSELEALMQSAEGRFAALPGFMRVRRYNAVDVVRSGVKVAEEKSEKQDVGAVLEVAEFSDPNIVESAEFKALEAWYQDALDPLVSYRSFRPFKLHKGYEATAAIKAGQ